MDKLRTILAFGLAALSAGAIVWCTVAARPVRVPTVPPPPATEHWDHSGARAAPAVRSGRKATTEVTLTRAGEADLGAAPAGRVDERQLQVKVTITHRLSMDEGDSLATALRQGTRFPQQLRRFTDAGFGAVKVDGAVLTPATRLAPVLTTSAGRTTVRFTITLLRQVEPEDLLRIGFETPAARPPLITDRKVTLLPGEWTVLRAVSIRPDREERERLEFTMELEPVSVTLARADHGFPDVAEKDDFSWATALGVLTAAMLTTFLLRALGTEWWRRPPNRELVAGLALTAPALLVAIVAGQGKLLAYVLLFCALPALTLRHASRVLPTGPGWTAHDVLGATVAGALVAAGMLTWSFLYGQLPGGTLLLGGAVTALAAAASAVAFSVDLGIRTVSVRLAAAAAGSAIGLLALALWAKALLTGAYPPDSVRLVLAFGWALIPVAAVAVVTKRWTRGATVVAVLVSLLVQGWPRDWLDAGSWSLPLPGQDMPRIGELELTPLVRGVMGLLLLGFLLLVLRLRRLGLTLEAGRDPAAESIMIICLMVVHLTPPGSAFLADPGVPLPTLSITSIVAWVTARWLLNRPDPSIVEPRDQEEHRELIRAALHRRMLLGSEQELYRTGRGRIGRGDLVTADFEHRRQDLESALRRHGGHPETAFATGAGCVPWYNGLHAFVISLLLSLPFLYVYGPPDGADLNSFVFETRSMIALPAFGFLFGYFYPRVRGGQPMSKALHLMGAALVTELSGHVPALVEPDLGAAVKAQVVAIVVGEVALVSIGLGLYWEWRVMYLAGEPWARVRSLRSLRSLATPLLAVVIAVVTAVATTAAGHTVDRILKGDQRTSLRR